MNRYSNYSTSQFQPLSLEEIMYVPLAKQQQHDQFQQSADKLSEFDFNRLKGDDIIAQKELQEYRNEVNSYVDELHNSGVSKNLINKLTALKNKYQKKMSPSGSWGKMSNNYDSVKNWRDEIFKDKNLSNEEAQQLYAMKLDNFKTVNDDGTYNNFIGKYAPEDFDKRKVIDDAIKGINPDKYALTDKKGNPIQSLGNLDSFTELLMTGNIEELQRDKIISSVNQQLLADPAIRKRLEFEAYLNGQDPKKALDFFDTKVNDKKEVVYDFDKPLNSIGYMIAGKANGASYKKVTPHYFTNEDKKAIADYTQHLKNVENDRQRRLDGIPITVTNGPTKPLARYDRISEVTNKITDIKKQLTTLNPESNQYLQLNDNLQVLRQMRDLAELQFNKNNPDFAKEELKELEKAGIPKEKLDLILDEYNNLNFVDLNNPYYIDNDFINKFPEYSKATSAQKRLISGYREKLNERDKLVAKEFVQDSRLYHLGFSKDKGKLDNYLTNSLPSIFDKNTLEITSVYGSDKNGNPITIKKKDIEKLKNQLLNPAFKKEFDALQENNSVQNNEMLIKMQTDDKSYVMVGVKLGDLYDPETYLMTPQGAMLNFLGNNTNIEGSNVIKSFQIDQQNRYLKSTIDENYYNPITSEIIKNRINTQLTHKEYQYNIVRTGETNLNKEYKIRMKYGDKAVDITYDDALHMVKNKESLSVSLIKQIAKEKYPTLYNDNPIESFRKVKDNIDKGIIDESDYYYLPVKAEDPDLLLMKLN